MKSIKIVSFVMAASLTALAAVSASAATLTPASPDSSAEVTAKIEGAGPGEVSYIITIPDKIDFGTLTQPQEDVNSYKDVEYTVTATEITNLSENQWVNVYVKDQGATDEDDRFYITQTTEPFTKLSYDVYSGAVSETPSINNGGDMGENGYLLAAFNQTGQEINGVLRLDQKQIYNKNIDEIAGDYKGYMVFHSAVGSVI